MPHGCPVSVASVLPVAGSQRERCCLPNAVRIRVPSGAELRANHLLLMPRKRVQHLARGGVPHTCVLSSDAVTIRVPSG